MSEYDVLIRTYNSSATIPEVLGGVASLAPPPANVIVIDSGSTDDTKAICAAAGGRVYDYDGGDFNYSRALNQGFRHVTSSYCLVLSSHVSILKPDLVGRMLDLIHVGTVKAVYVDFCKERESVEIVDRSRFNGRNGLWNPCALYTTEMVRHMGFDEAMPASEDQQFAARLFSMGYATAALGGPWVRYLNPRTSLKKHRNDYVAVAYFIYNENLSIRNIMSIARSGFRSFLDRNFALCYDRWALSLRLFAARLRKPRFASKYF